MPEAPGTADRGSGGSSLHSRLAAWLILALAVAALYGHTLGFGFLHDDFYFARPLSAREVAGTLVGNWEPHGLGNQHYRPLTALTLALDFGLWGTDARGYHLTSLVCFAAALIVAYELLRALLGPAAALAGALAWAAHPLSAASAAWANQRSDSLAAGLYLAALLAFVRADGRRAGFAVVLLAAAALGSKEMAVTLPAALLAVARLGFGPRPGWRAACLGAALVGLVYVVTWQRMFPDKFAARLEQPEEGRLATFVQLLAPVFVPLPEETWWRLQAGPAGAALLVLGCLLPLAGVARLVRGPGRRPSSADHTAGTSVSRLVTLGLVWPVLALPPLLGLTGPDVHRLGFLPAFGAAVLVACATAKLLERRGRVALLLPAALLAASSRAALANAAAWGPGGHQYSTMMRWDASNPAWRLRLTPEMRAVFEAQLRRDLPHWARRKGSLRE